MEATGKPLISVIIPVYNVKSYLASCIQSVREQTYRHLEIIIVDDGSTDGSGELCDLLALQDSRIKVVHKTNGGLASARNAGLDIAHGEYFGFVDSDDTITSQMYEFLLKAAEKDDCPLSVCQFRYVFPDGKTMVKTKDAQSCVFDFNQAIIEMNIYRYFDMSACTKLFRADLFSDLRFPVGKLSEDFFVMPQVLDKARRISFIAEACYNYYQRSGSISRGKTANYDFEEAARKQLEFLEAKHPDMAMVGHVAYASSVLTEYDQCITNHLKCEKERVRHFKRVVRSNMRFVMQSSYASPSKKLQIVIFVFSLPLYRLAFKVFKRIRRV
ncbi:glycosyltransferase [Bifidobacterium sp. ESL0769]|uniref:glycosyltransferase family 2 protein n=1 Tax=Bifidobacterium sp. ESL0769 TaxID=2983229 RepID=UPI0023F78339|nr:glycosyltransferase [Bifidobacterium sp. ESL0769]WEV67736.1 glycosyltransferase [Bifidobacterium sp. ESL0769]